MLLEKNHRSKMGNGIVTVWGLVGGMFFTMQYGLKHYRACKSEVFNSIWFVTIRPFKNMVLGGVMGFY